MNTCQFLRASKRTSVQPANQQQNKQLLAHQPAKQEHNTSSTEDDQPPPRLPQAAFAHSATTSPPAFIYAVIVLMAMIYGLVTHDLHLIYVAIGLAAAPHVKPSILKVLLDLIKGNFPR